MKNILILLFMLCITGCVASDPNLMTPSEVSVTNQIMGTAQINVVGSNERIITNEAIRSAIENAIVQNSIFSNDSKQFRLNASVLAIENPLIGASLKAELRIRWVLYDTESSEEVFNEVISNEYIATMGDSIVALQRMKIANENVVKDNIRIALEKISAGEY